MDYLQYLYVTGLTAALIEVLNLIINGLPSILKMESFGKMRENIVLNLIINGLPSILNLQQKGIKL